MSMDAIRIYRFGLPVKDVFSDVELEAWIKENVPPLIVEHVRIDQRLGLPSCLNIAKIQNYTFKRVKVQDR